METFKQYRKKQLAEMRAYVEGESMEAIAVNEVDKAAGSPKVGDFIARNPLNPHDQWLVAAQFVAENYEPV